MLALPIELAERGLVPDPWLRRGIRHIVKSRAEKERRTDAYANLLRFAKACEAAPVALHADQANAQHYEVPAAFFEQVLGPRLKYSCGYFLEECSTLADAEEAMLALTCGRADLSDGQRILELGCGWGSLTLWMAEKYPRAAITAVSNSRDQRVFIEAKAAERGLDNITVVTADMNAFHPEGQFDRIVSVEMLEHMRNYGALFERVASWLAPEGKVFAHIFCHKSAAYAYETEGAANWMGRYFFTGGTMPAFELFSHFSDHLRIEQTWQVDGMHYYRTAMCWLANMDRRRGLIMPILRQAYGTRDGHRWFNRWRMFFLACAELFAHDGGREWFVAHYRFTKA